MGGFRSSGEGDTVDFVVNAFLSADELPVWLGPVAKARDKGMESLWRRAVLKHTDRNMVQRGDASATQYALWE